MSNTWPKGYRHGMYPHEHEAWNAQNYPGTRELCFQCEEPTGRCEEDSIYIEDEGPFCEECYEIKNIQLMNKTNNITVDYRWFKNGERQYQYPCYFYMTFPHNSVVFSMDSFPSCWSHWHPVVSGQPKPEAPNE
jgi:hypothetical protein